MRARGRLQPAGADRKTDPDRLTADIDDQLDAELFETASTVGVAEPEPERTAPRTGDLADTDPALLLGRAFQEVWTGQLVLRGGRGVEKSIHLDGGRPVYATSTALEDRLGEMLLRQGRIDANQRARVARLAAESGRRTGAVLVDMALLKPGELLATLRTQHESVLLSVIPWQEGSYAFHPDAPLDARKARLLRHPAALVHEALRNGYPPAAVQRRLGPPGTVLALVHGPETGDLLAELTLDAGERQVLPWFDGIRTLAEVARASRQGEEVVSAVAFVLSCFGVMAPASAARGMGRRSFDQRVDRARILARFALVQDADYFQILGLDRDAGTAEVVRAHRQLAQELGAATLAPEVTMSLAREIEVVQEVLAEALRVLSDESLRRSYREHLVSPYGPRRDPA
jgi:hypothetical protein